MNELFSYCLDAECNEITDVGYSRIENSLDSLESDNKTNGFFINSFDLGSIKISEVRSSAIEDYLERFFWI